VRDARHKLVLRLEAGAVEELYDLKTDAGNKMPLPAAAEREARIRFLQAARKHVGKRAELDKMARLKARLREIRVKLGHNRSKAS
jgi:hypothetical protein